jgi:hypothetical protein
MKIFYVIGSLRLDESNTASFIIADGKNTVSTSFLELKKIRNTKKYAKLLLFNKLF